MALALTLDAAPDEALKGFYVEKDGKYHLDVTGIEDTNQMRIELATVKREAAERRKAAKDMEERFAGIDPEKVRTMMAKLDQDGEAKLLAEGKIEEVVNNRTEKLRADLQKQLDEAHSKTTSAEARVKQYSQRVLDDRIRDAVMARFTPVPSSPAMYCGRRVNCLCWTNTAMRCSLTLPVSRCWVRTGKPRSARQSGLKA